MGNRNCVRRTTALSAPNLRTEREKVDPVYISRCCRAKRKPDRGFPYHFDGLVLLQSIVSDDFPLPSSSSLMVKPPNCNWTHTRWPSLSTHKAGLPGAPAGTS